MAGRMELLGRFDTRLTCARVDELEPLRILKARYFRHLDRKEWDEFRTLFTDDVHVDVTDDVGADHGIREGRDRFVDGVMRMLDGVVTVHHGHMPELHLTDADTATGIWAMEDRLDWPDGRVTTGAGHYEEEYRRVGGEWKISRMRLVRLRVETR